MRAVITSIRTEGYGSTIIELNVAANQHLIGFSVGDVVDIDSYNSHAGSVAPPSVAPPLPNDIDISLMDFSKIFEALLKIKKVEDDKVIKEDELKPKRKLRPESADQH
jgi:hypothetical protein